MMACNDGSGMVCYDGSGKGVDKRNFEKNDSKQKGHWRLSQGSV